MASLSQGRAAAAQCGLFTHKSVPVIFEPPCTNILLIYIDPGKNCIDICYIRFFTYVITFMIVVLYGAVAQTKFPKPKFFAG